MRFHEFFKKARLKAKLTQERVAFHLGYRSGQFVSNWERGISLPPNEELLRLAEYLKADATLMVDLAMAEKKYSNRGPTKSALKRRANRLKGKYGQARPEDSEA